jgi:hypothetical protein
MANPVALVIVVLLVIFGLATLGVFVLGPVFGGWTVPLVLLAAGVAGWFLAPPRGD